MTINDDESDRFQHSRTDAILARLKSRDVHIASTIVERAETLFVLLAMERGGWGGVPVVTNLAGFMSGPADGIKSVGSELNAAGGFILMWATIACVADAADRKRIGELWDGVGEWTEGGWDVGSEGMRDRLRRDDT